MHEIVWGSATPETREASTPGNVPHATALMASSVRLVLTSLPDAVVAMNVRLAWDCKVVCVCM